MKLVEIITMIKRYRMYNWIWFLSQDCTIIIFMRRIVLVFNILIFLISPQYDTTNPKFVKLCLVYKWRRFLFFLQDFIIIIFMKRIDHVFNIWFFLISRHNDMIEHFNFFSLVDTTKPKIVKLYLVYKWRRFSSQDYNVIIFMRRIVLEFNSLIFFN